MNGLLFLLLLPKHYNVVSIYITLGITNDIKVILKRQEDICRVYPSAFCFSSKELEHSWIMGI